jgi:hypothetical protein
MDWKMRVNLEVGQKTIRIYDVFVVNFLFRPQRAPASKENALVF